MKIALTIGMSSMVKALLFVVLLGIIGGSSGFRFGRSWGDPAWYYQRLVWALGVACLFAWGWVAKSVLVLPSPVHRVQFYDEHGRVSLGKGKNVGCHGRVYVVDEYAWRACRYQMGRFSLAKGRADLLWSLPYSVGVAAVIRSVEPGGLLFTDSGGTVFKLRAGGGGQRLGALHGVLVCMRRLGNERLEFVYSTGKALRRAVWSAGDWERYVFTQPPFGDDTLIGSARYSAHGSKQTFQAIPGGCFLDREVWRGVWFRFPIDNKGDGDVPFEVWVGTEDGGWTRQMWREPVALNNAEWSSEKHRLMVLDNGQLFLTDGGLDRSSGGGVFSFRRMTRWLTPQGTEVAVDRGSPASLEIADLVTPNEGLEVIRSYSLRGPQSRWRVQAGGEWYGLSESKQAFVRFKDEEGQTVLSRGDDAVRNDWWSSGWDSPKFFPDGQGGFWAMNGSTYIHLDSKLNRTDHFSFVERFQMTLSGSSWKKKAGFLWVLFAAPLTFVLLGAAGWRYGSDSIRIRQAGLWGSLMVLGGVLLSFKVFWELSGRL